VLLDDIALVNFALTLGAQESWVPYDDCANGRDFLTAYHGRCHASHRVAQKNRSRKPEPLDESNDIACVILVPIPVERVLEFPWPLASGITTSYSPSRARAKGIQQAPLPVNPWSRTSGGLHPPVLKKWMLMPFASQIPLIQFVI
jgi:hypothetical protein